MESLVLFASIQLEFVAWVVAISFFVSVAVTAVLSPNRQWFELVVIFSLAFVLNTILVGLIVQGIAGIELIEIEAIERIERGSFSG